MADGDEQAVHGQLPVAAVVAGKAHAGDAGLVAEHFGDRVVPDEADLAGALALEQPVLQDLFATQAVTAVHEGHVPGDVRQVEGLLDRRVAATDHRHVLAAVEKSVAGGARRDPAAAELGLGRQAEVAGRGPGRDDQRLAGVGRRLAVEQEGPARQVDRLDRVVDELGRESLRMAFHPLHQRRSHEAVRVAGPVVDLGRRHQLATDLQTRDQERLAVGAGGVDGGGVAGRSRTENDELRMAWRGHGRRRAPERTGSTGGCAQRRGFAGAPLIVAVACRQCPVRIRVRRTYL